MSTSTAAEYFAKTTFDIVIVGAGTAALPIAAKLSENPEILVGVLEAGEKNDNDPLIDTPQLLGSTTGNPKYDWKFASVPQEHALGRAIGFPRSVYLVHMTNAFNRSSTCFRGKGVGGSTLINYLAWDRASKAEYDTWKTFGEKEDAWDWDSLIPYFKASEAAAPLSTNPNEYPSMAALGAVIIHPGVENAIGGEGAVKTSHNSIYSDVIPPYVKAWNNIGASINTNPWGGDASGLYNVRLAVDRKTGKRASADSAYLTPEVLPRQNLKILTGAQATKLLFKRETDNVTATGVEFVVEGKTYVANASKEVVLSAGVIQTPQLLELSGIGNRKILEGLGIEPLVDLAGVGENVQDHLFVPMQFLLKPGTKTFDELRNNPDFLAEQQAVYDSSRTGWLAAVDSTVCYNPLSKIVAPAVFGSMLERLEASIAKDKEQGALTPLQEAQYTVQLDLLRAGEVPGLETLLMSKGYVAPEQGKSYFIMMTGVQHPFSRGSIHIDSTDPFKAPLIDPNFLSNEFDLESLLAGYRLMEKVVAAEPLKDLIEIQQLPPAILSEDEHALGFIRAAATTGSHLMGSCALARRDLGGVVGNNLKVHGTSNLRIADASIIPLSVSCHIQATVFAIGERAGDIIKRDL